MLYEIVYLIWYNLIDRIQYFAKFLNFYFDLIKTLIQISNFLTKESWETASNVVLKRYKDDVDTGNEFQRTACILNIQNSAVVMFVKNVDAVHTEHS